MQVCLIQNRIRLLAWGGAARPAATTFVGLGGAFCPAFALRLPACRGCPGALGQWRVGSSGCSACLRYRSPQWVKGLGLGHGGESGLTCPLGPRSGAWFYCLSATIGVPSSWGICLPGPLQGRCRCYRLVASQLQLLLLLLLLYAAGTVAASLRCCCFPTLLLLLL